MSYSYQVERPHVFTEEGQVKFLAVRDFAAKAFNYAGAVTAGKLVNAYGSGDSWQALACVDRLVEIGEIREVTVPGSVCGQNRVFV